MSEKRFEKVYSQGVGVAGGMAIFVDKETGVNYVWMTQGYAGGLTPLLDAEGKVVVTKTEE